MTELTQEVAANEQFEAETIGARVDGHDYTIAELRKISDRVFDATNWKAPWTAYVPYQLVPVVTAAVEFFHADTPRVVGMEPAPSTGRVLMAGRGYQG